MFNSSFTKYIFLFLLSLSYVPELYCQTDFYKAYNESSKKYVEGKFDDALQINLKLLEKAEKLKVPAYIAYADLQVGNMHYFLEDKKLAVKWYMIALGVVESEKIDSMKPELYHNISVMYNELGIVDSTLKYSQKAISIYKANKNFTELSRALSALVDIYMANNRNLKEAEKLINEAEKYAKLANDERVLAYAHTKRAALYGKQNRFKEAAEELKIPEEIYRKTNVADELMYLYRVGSVYYTKAGDPRGLSYMDSLLKWKDAIFKKETAKKVAESEALYQTEKKERENKLLQQENNLKQAKIDSRNKTIIGLVIGILLIGVIVAWRISLINLKKKESELQAIKNIQKEKERISRDLHDNVGGQLSYVLYSLDGIEGKSKVELMDLTSDINQAIRGVVGNLRETIWAISDEHLTVTDISDKLKVYSKSLFRNTKIKIVFNENIQNNKELNSLTGLNLYRICQEILNNAFKYSKSNELLISIVSHNSTTISIKDNGIGFDKTNIDYGYGLENIESRAKESNISVEFKSVTGEGTEYVLVV